MRHFRIAEADRPVEYHSIGAMITTFAAAYYRGIFFVDAEGYLEADDSAYAVLAAELNPAVPWWSEP